MKSPEQIWQLIEESVSQLPAGNHDLDQCLGKVLREPVFADADQPSFDRSGIDGYALRLHSSPGRYKIAGEITPGSRTLPQPAPGEAWRIFTGAEVPQGCGLVMLEDTNVEGDWVEIHYASDENQIRRKGSTVVAGQRILEPGTLIGPGEIALLASVGKIRIQVTPQPRIIHITTGTEIVPTEQTPDRGQIRDTNGPLIRALATQWGAPVLKTAHVDESMQSLVDQVNSSPAFDVLLVSGGSSVGAYDHTPSALEALGFEILSRRVNAKPGKPLVFARRGQQIAFGIPGNPVSHFASWHVFIRRALDQLAGRKPCAAVAARLQAGANLRSSDRDTFWPAETGIRDGVLQARPLPWLDSGDLSALRGIHALIHLPANQQAPRSGDAIHILPSIDTVHLTD